MSKRRRLHASELNSAVYTSFPRKYIGYLLPALLQATSCENNDQQLQTKVRFEVDMALVVSSGEFNWTRALKHKLGQQCVNTKSVSLEVIGTGIVRNRSDGLRLHPHPHIPRPIVEVRKTGTVKRLDQKDDEELGCRMRKLRKILPGGREMSTWELLSEVESYVVCLQMQVDILRSLVDAQ